MTISEARTGPLDRPVLTLLFLAALGLLIGLGVWQLQRLTWKQNLLARIAALDSAPALPLEPQLQRAEQGEDVNYVRVVADCPGLDQSRFLKLYALIDGRTGYRAISRCRIDAAPYRSILIDRGFVSDEDAGRMPPPGRASAGHRPVVGLLRVGGKATFVTPHNRVAENSWFSRDVPAMARALGAPAPAPVFLMLESPAPPGFGPKPSPVPTQISNRHLSYAVTWFGLAAALAGVYGAMILRGRRS